MGEVIDAAEANRRKRNGQYIMCINEEQYIDADLPDNFNGRYINDGGPSGVKNNAKMDK